MRPVLFVLASSPHDAEGESGLFDVQRVDAANVGAVVEQIARHAGSRWMLVGGPGAEPVAADLMADLVADVMADVMADVVAAALSGRARIFGLSGVVTPGVWRGDPSVPRIELGPGDSAIEAAERLWREHAGRGPQVPADVIALMATDRVSARTRGIHARRALADDPHYRPVALGPESLDVLRVLADAVVPQDGDPETWVDLAARVDAQLAAGRGDGWRPAELPPDGEAYALALDELSDLPAMTPDARDEALAEVADGRRALRTAGLTAAQLTAWFEDARNDLVRQWLAHPASLSRIGFDGYATGGPQLLGFVDPSSPGREAWEPALPEPSRGGAA